MGRDLTAVLRNLQFSHIPEIPAQVGVVNQQFLCNRQSPGIKNG
jgi:hypothetical protein